MEAMDLTTEPYEKSNVSLKRRFLPWFNKRTTAVCVGLSLLASLSFTINSVIAKILLSTNNSSSTFLSFSRMVLMIFYVTPIVTANRTNFIQTPDLRTHWITLAVRCFGGTVGILLYYTALEYSPLSEAGIIFNACAPVFASILSCAILHEKFRFLDILLFLTSACGVLLILRPPLIFPPELSASQHDIPFMRRLIGSGCALGASICQATAILCMRMLTKIDAALIVFWFAVSGSASMLPIAIGFGQFQLPTCYIHRTGAVICALSSTLGQLLLTFSSRHISAPVISLIRSSELAFLFAAQTLLLQTVPHFLSIIGSFIVVLSMAVLMFRAFVIDKLKTSAEKTDASFFAPNGRFNAYLQCLTK